MPLSPWQPLPQYTPDEDGLDVIRQIAHSLCDYMDFHEIALSDPFEAENQLQRVGEMLKGVVGWPKGFGRATWIDDE